GQLARSLPGTGLSSEAVGRVVERSAGNPRAAIELSQAAAAGRPNRLPPSVRHTVAVRVSTLSAAAGEVLEALGILEPEPELQLVLALPEATDAALVELTEAGLVHVSGDQRRTVVRFRHPLYRDATRERTIWARRRMLHAQVADVLERMHCGRDVAAILRTARHRELGGEAERAVDYLGAAAGALRAAGDARSAGDLFLATLQTLVRNPGLAGSRSGVLLSAMQELSLAGRWIEVLPIAERVWPTPSRTPAGENAQLAAVLGTSLLMTGRIEEANTLLARQVSQLEGAGRALAAPSLLAAAAAAALHEGHLAKAQRLCQLAARTREPGVRGLARCLAVAVRFRSDRDRTAAAAEFGALSHAVRADGLTELAAFARWNQARMTTRMEDALRVEAMGERAYPLMAAPARLLTATIHLLEGRESRAGAALERARSELTAAVPLLTPLVDGLQAHVDLHLGEVERARSRLEPWGGERADVRSLARAVVLGAQGWFAWETDSLEVAAERFGECADECAASGYGLLESRSPLLPLHVDALLRLGSAGQARRAVQAAAAGGGTDRFSRAALAAGRFRLSP
ncbi:MAG TPA: hypothetical protein VLW53_02665, partial [Candidatus Eisenbacteria bacterium]|nr:hypothetical protein [Candidatus Eisenbacteria bacterium]